MNNRLFLLLVCLLGMFFLCQGAEIYRQCAFGYDNSQGGSRAFAAILDNDVNSFSQKNFPLNNVDFSGYCYCTLSLYSKINFKGYSISCPYSEGDAGHIYVNEIWGRKTNSFKVVCSF